MYFAAYPDGRVRKVETPFDHFDPHGVDDELLRSGTDAVLICDSLTPSTRTRAFTIVVTSPQESVWSEYFKGGSVARLFMPRYTLEELEGLRAAAFPHITSEEVKRRFGLYGGNPRLVLAWSEEQVESRIAADLSGLGPHDIPRDSHDESLGSCHKVMYLSTDGEDSELGLSPTEWQFYKFAGSAPSTNYTASLLLAQVNKVDRESVRVLEQGTGSMAVIAGKALENRVLEEVSEGMQLQLTLYPLGERGACLSWEKSGNSGRRCSVCGLAGHDKRKHKLGDGAPKPKKLTIRLHPEHVVDEIEHFRELREAGVSTCAYVPKAGQPAFDVLLAVQSDTNGRKAHRFLWVNVTLSASHTLKLETATRRSMLNMVKEFCPEGDVEVVWWTLPHVLKRMRATVKAVELRTPEAEEAAKRIQQYVATHEAQEMPTIDASR